MGSGAFNLGWRTISESSNSSDEVSEDNLSNNEEENKTETATTGKQKHILIEDV